MKTYLKSLIAQRLKYKWLINQMDHLSLSEVSNVLRTTPFSRIIDPIEVDYPSAKIALIISPHPDDDLYGMGGTIMKMVNMGITVYVVYLKNAKIDNKQLRIELKTVREKIGYYEIYFSDLGKVINEYKPDIIFLPHLFDDHPDHRAANHDLLMANPKKQKEVWAYQVYSQVIPNVVIDITQQMDEKEYWMKSLSTQQNRRDWAHYIKGQNAVNVRWLKTNEARYAESFFVLPMDEYLYLCRKYYG